MVVPVGRNWLRQWFQTLTLSFTFVYIYKHSQAQWHDSRNSGQQYNSKSSSLSSTRHRACWFLWRTGKVKETCSETFPEGCNWGGWAEQEWNAPEPTIVLTLWTNRVIPLFHLSERVGSDVANMEWNKQNSCLCQQTDLELNSKCYLYPIRRAPQWNTVSKCWWLCRNMRQSILKRWDQYLQYQTQVNCSNRDG